MLNIPENLLFTTQAITNVLKIFTNVMFKEANFAPHKITSLINPLLVCTKETAAIEEREIYEINSKN